MSLKMREQRREQVLRLLETVCCSLVVVEWLLRDLLVCFIGGWMHENLPGDQQVRNCSAGKRSMGRCWTWPEVYSGDSMPGSGLARFWCVLATGYKAISNAQMCNAGANRVTGVMVLKTGMRTSNATNWPKRFISPRCW